MHIMKKKKTGNACKVKTFIDDMGRIESLVNEFIEQKDIEVMDIQTHLMSNQYIAAFIIYREVVGDGRK